MAMSSGVDRRFFAVVDEVAVAGRFDEVGRQVRGPIQIRGERERLLDQIARMAAAQRDLARPVVLVEQVLDQSRFERRAEIAAAVRERSG